MTADSPRPKRPQVRHDVPVEPIVIIRGDPRQP